MSSRNYAITVVALVAVSAVVLWALWSRNQPEQRAATYQTSNDAIYPAAPEPLISSTPAFEENEAAAVTSDDDPVVAAPAESAAWQASALAFAKQDDADPTLSRHLEAEMQKLIDTTIDRTKYDAQSVTCRTHRCQVIASDRILVANSNAPADRLNVVNRLNVVTGGPMSAIVPPIIIGANNAGILDPSTGATIKAQVERAQSFRTEPAAIEIIISFSSP